MTDFGGAVRDSRAYKLAILGVPFDEKSCFLRGAALGPAAIRAASTGKALNPYTELGVDLEHNFKPMYHLLRAKARHLRIEEQLIIAILKPHAFA